MYGQLTRIERETARYAPVTSSTVQFLQERHEVTRAPAVHTLASSGVASFDPRAPAAAVLPVFLTGTPVEIGTPLSNPSTRET